jgi:uncharacterized membrane protein
LACQPGRPEGVDSGESHTGGTADCADVPAMTWNNFGRGFTIEACQGCHASTVEGDARFGAPEWVVFDTVDQVWAVADLVLAVCTGEAPSMPPQGGVTDDDRARLQWWLSCGEPGT